MSKLNDGIGEILSVVAKFAGPVSEELGQLVRDQVRYFRAKNLLSIFQKTKRLLADAGIEPQPIPPRLLLPAIDSASGEDDELLQDRWANLLANAASPNGANVLPAFVEVLKQMNPGEALILDRLYQVAMETVRRFGPDRARAMYDRGIMVGTFSTISSQLAVGTPTKVESLEEREARREIEALLIDDLVRLGLLNRIQYQGPKQESLTRPSIYPGDTIYLVPPFALGLSRRLPASSATVALLQFNSRFFDFPMSDLPMIRCPDLRAIPAISDILPVNATQVHQQAEHHFNRRRKPGPRTRPCFARRRLQDHYRRRA